MLILCPARKINNYKNSVIGKIGDYIKNKLGFTLLELLVVVLIIGILASIALPQYQMAVTKSRVASILPLMRRWKDAMAEWKLQHDSYCKNNTCSQRPDGADLGVNWPSDWKINNQPCGDSIECENDYWTCFPNEEQTGYVYCQHVIDNDNTFYIVMYQPDDPNIEKARDMVTCQSQGDKAEKVCKTLGGQLIEGVTDWGPVYRL